LHAREREGKKERKKEKKKERKTFLEYVTPSFGLALPNSSSVG